MGRMYLVFGILRSKSICKDAHEFEQDPEVDGELIKNFKSRAVTQSDLCLRKTILVAFWEVFLKMATPEEKKRERGLLQVKNSEGLRKWWI